MKRPEAIPATKPLPSDLSPVDSVSAKQIVFSANGVVAYEVVSQSVSGKSLHVRRVWDYRVCWVDPLVYPKYFWFTDVTVPKSAVRVLTASE